MKTLTVLLLLSATAHADTLMGVSADVSYTESTATGMLTTLVNPAGGELLVALTTDPKSGTVYGIDLGGWPTLPMQLVGFDAAGAVAVTTEITYLGQPVLLAEGLSFAPNGKLYISFGHPPDFQWYESGHLGVVDPSTGVIDPTSVVAMSPAVAYANADADMLEWVGGTLYIGDNLSGVGTNLYTASTATGATTLVGQIKDAASAYQVTDLAWDGSTLWAQSIGGQLLTVDRSTATAAKIGTSAGFDLDGITATASCHGSKCK